MFDRALLKKNAKKLLARFYGLALLATLIYGILGGFSGGSGISYNFGSQNTGSSETAGSDIDLSETFSGDFEEVTSQIQEYFETHDIATPATIALSGVALFGIALGVAYALCVKDQVEVGYSRFYLNARENDANIGDLFWTYKHNFGTTIATLLCRDIYVFLWTLLLIIPGIIKSYQYSMIPYLLGENPNMTRKRAFELSREMTKGHKWDLFVLDLSFIGWYLLGMLCCCIGQFFVIPYHEASKAEAYTFLKARALESGAATEEDFPGFYSIVTVDEN